ncbi:MAG: hypothetical protein ABIH46_10205, partial [Chloroflexota bacterium]
TIPPLAPELQKRLRTRLAPVGTSAANPVDVGTIFPEFDHLKASLEAAVEDGNTDTIIVDALFLYVSFDGEDTRRLMELPVQIKKSTGKAMAIVLTLETTGTKAMELEEKRRRAVDYYHSEGIPVFLTLERAAGAIARVVSYREWVAAHCSE